MRADFETYKGNVCHQLKRLGDLEFINMTAADDEIRKCWSLDWHPEALYLLALVDYLCRVNNLPVLETYNDLRSMKLRRPAFPRDAILLKTLDPNLDLYEVMRNESIPEFSQFNIMEVNIRDVC
jgi:hypothetical protein